MQPDRTCPHGHHECRHCPQGAIVDPGPKPWILNQPSAGQVLVYVGNCVWEWQDIK
jgi:hypothetical protein